MSTRQKQAVVTKNVGFFIGFCLLFCLILLSPGATAKSLYVVGNSNRVQEDVLWVYDVQPDGKIVFQTTSSPWHDKGAGNVNGLGVDSDTNTLFLTFSGFYDAGTVDSESLVFKEFIYLVPWDVRAGGLVYDEARSRVYVTDEERDRLIIYDWVPELPALHNIGDGASEVLLSAPTAGAIAFDSSQEKVYVASMDNGVEVLKVAFDRTEWQLIGSIGTTYEVQTLSVDARNQSLYAGGRDTGGLESQGATITKYNLATGDEMQAIAIDGAHAVLSLCVDNATSLVYVLVKNLESPLKTVNVYNSALQLIQSVTVTGDALQLYVPSTSVGYNPLDMTITPVSGVAQSNGQYVAGPGAEIEYQICVTNSNQFPVTDIILTNTLPSELDFVRAQGLGNALGVFDGASNTYFFHNPSLNPNSSQCFSIVARVREDVISGTVITNSVAVDSNETPQSGASVDVEVGYNTLGLTKTVVPDPNYLTVGNTTYVDAGAYVTYQICLSNLNNTTAVSNVLVIDQLSENVEFVSAEQVGLISFYDAGTHSFSWAFNAIEPNFLDCCNITIRIKDNVPPGQVISNEVMLGGSETFTVTAVADIVVSAPNATNVLYVDANAIDNPVQDGTVGNPYVAIQQAIDMAQDGNTVVVLPGLYVESLNFKGKAICVTSLVLASPEVLAPLEEPNSLGAIDITIIHGNYEGTVVVFESGEDANTILQGFTITGGMADSGGGILCYNSSPTISHCVITGNQATRVTGGGVDSYRSEATFINCTITGNHAARGGGGVSSDRGADVFINCILWGNTPDAIMAVEEDVSLTYCTVEGDWFETGNLDYDPNFVATGYWALPEDMNVPASPDTENAVWVSGDYHLKSMVGHYDIKTATWMSDAVSSPCIDAGDPNTSYEFEPVPNGVCVNMGAYGGTLEASKTTLKLSLLHSVTLDTDPGWTTQGQWQYGRPLGGGGANGHPDPSSAFTGQTVYGVNLAGDYDTTEGEPYSLTAGPFDCRGRIHMTLRFARWLNSDAARFVRNSIEVSNDGATWQVIWEPPRDSETIDSAWQVLEYDISAVANLQSTVWIRWSYEVVGHAFAYSGWNIDDIEIWGISPTQLSNYFVYGWNSLTRQDSIPLIADDWHPDGILPVQGFRWWGAFDNWTNAEMPIDLPLGFHFGIWSHNPTLNKPGSLMWEHTTSSWDWVHTGQVQDAQGQIGGESVFQFTSLVSQDEWFYPSTTPNTAHWLSITPIYTSSVISDTPWGWMTRQTDGTLPAERILAVNNPAQWPPVVGATYVAGSPVTYPALKHWDVAFELITGQPTGRSTSSNNLSNAIGDFHDDDQLHNHKSVKAEIAVE